MDTVMAYRLWSVFRIRDPVQATWLGGGGKNINISLLAVIKLYSGTVPAIYFLGSQKGLTQ